MSHASQFRALQTQIEQSTLEFMVPASTTTGQIEKSRSRHYELREVLLSLEQLKFSIHHSTEITKLQ